VPQESDMHPVQPCELKRHGVGAARILRAYARIITGNDVADALTRMAGD